MSGQWLVSRRPNPSARLRLICFPYAGGGSGVFASWADLLPSDIEVHAVRLPGRESRVTQRPYGDVAELMGALGPALLPVCEQPFALFGHSMGALVGYEFTRWLRSQGGPAPAHLFVSARQAPHLRRRPPHLHDMPDGPFVDGLRRLGGTPEELLTDPRVMGMLMPGLRADFRLNDGYRHRPGPPLACPVTAFGGRQDHVVDEPGLRAWREHTTGPFASGTFEGGHFFLHSARDELLGAIGAALAGPIRHAQGTAAR